MLLLRSVLVHALGETCCEGWLDEPFASFCGGEVPVALGLELIAQAAAVHHGLLQLARGSAHVPAARGLLLGSRRLELGARVLPIMQPLRVTVMGGQEPPGPGGLIRFEGSVTAADGTLLVRGDATVLEWRPDDVQIA